MFNPIRKSLAPAAVNQKYGRKRPLPFRFTVVGEDLSRAGTSQGPVNLADSNPTGENASNNKKESCNIVNLDE
jgi:hypothetical protein